MGDLPGDGGASLGFGQLEGWGVGRSWLMGTPAGAVGGWGGRGQTDDSEGEGLGLREA